jgi:hypothetical protein
MSGNGTSNDYWPPVEVPARSRAHARFSQAPPRGNALRPGPARSTGYRGSDPQKAPEAIRALTEDCAGARWTARVEIAQ